MAPAIQASNPDLVSSLKESGGSGTEGAHLRSALVALQIAMALVLLIGAGLMINSFMRIQNNSLGADPKNLLTFDFRFLRDEAIKPYGRYRNAGLWDINPQTTLTFQRVYERIQNLPRVISAAGAGTPPLAGALGMGFLIEGRPAPPTDANGQPSQTASYIAVTPNYFATLRTPILEGREFNDRDTASAPFVVVINQTMATRFWPGERAIGKRLRMDYVPDEPLGCEPFQCAREAESWLLFSEKVLRLFNARLYWGSALSQNILFVKPRVGSEETVIGCIGL